MSTTQTLAHLLTGLAFATAAAAQTVNPVATERFGRSSGPNAAVADQLELHVARQRSANYLQLRGGNTGDVVFVAVTRDRERLAHLGARHSGSIAIARAVAGPEGRTSIPLKTRHLGDGPLFARALILRTTSNGFVQRFLTHTLSISAVHPTAQTKPGRVQPDFSLLRIHLGPNRLAELHGAAKRLDPVAAVIALLNSPGDSVEAKFIGEVMVPLPLPVPIKVGGNVSVSTKLGRDDQGYTMTIAADVAAKVGAGAKLSKLANVKISGTAGYGAAGVFRFDTPAELTRGLRGLILELALGPTAQRFHSDNQRRMRNARRALQAVQARIAQSRARFRRVVRRAGFSRLARTLDRQATARRRALAGIRQVADLAEQLFVMIVKEREFLHAHSHYAELSFSGTVSGQLKIGDRVLKCIKLEAGVTGGMQAKLALRIYVPEPGKQPTLRFAQSITSAVDLSAGAKLDFSRKKKKSDPQSNNTSSTNDNTTSEDGASDNQQSKGKFLAVKNLIKDGVGIELKAKITYSYVVVFDLNQKLLAVLTPIEETLSVTRETQIGFFKRQTSASLNITKMSASMEEAGANLEKEGILPLLRSLIDTPIKISVQDSWIVSPELPKLEIGQIVSLTPSLNWVDAGPKRSIELTVPQMLHRMTDVKKHVADAVALIDDVRHLRRTR